ncbi:thioredoxin, mitochondrial [Leptidea sinapis]|uniref:thioredoxin, mitochondrial n=1 Tax=Leptidea sinapis TaxID=189913 RepID=UPI0021C4597C|nr:thioredoxin, mitochondrial [Leptidea sinapis]XP_050672151.1 thioredoxin, mitochondrial [Leptidea sinapis]
MLTRNATSLFFRKCYYDTTTPFFRKFTLTPANCEIVKIQSSDDFKAKVINSKLPVIVDFFATWCNPCKLLTPRLESIISENKGKIILAKVDIDEQTDLALDYEVSSVPVLVAIKNGKVQQRLVGLQDTDKLRKWIEQFASEDTELKVKA